MVSAAGKYTLSSQEAALVRNGHSTGAFGPITLNDAYIMYARNRLDRRIPIDKAWRAEYEREHTARILARATRP